MRNARRTGPPVAPTLGVEEVKFELDCDDGREANGGEPVDHPTQNMARIEIMRGSVKLITADEELRGILACGRRCDQRPGDRPHRAISITIFPHQAGLGRVASGDVDDNNRFGKETAGVIDGQHLVPPQPFAARHPAHVGKQHVDGVDVRMRREKGLCFGARGDLVR